MIYYIVIQQTHVWKQQSLGDNLPLWFLVGRYTVYLLHTYFNHTQIRIHTYVLPMCMSQNWVPHCNPWFSKINFEKHVNVTYSYSKSYPIIMNIILWRCVSPFFGGQSASPRSLRGATARGDGWNGEIPSIHRSTVRMN